MRRVVPLLVLFLLPPLLPPSATAIQLCYGIQVVLIQEALDKSSVNDLPDSSILTIHNIFYLSCVGEGDGQQVPQHILSVGRGLTGDRFAAQFPVSYIRIRGTAPTQINIPDQIKNLLLIVARTSFAGPKNCTSSVATEFGNVDFVLRTTLNVGNRATIAPPRGPISLAPLERN